MPFTYPTSDRDDVVEILHGVQIEDPYRWLEDPYSDRTKDWVEAQNEASGPYLAGLASRQFFADRLSEVLSAPRAGAPFRKAGRYFRFFNDGLAEQSSLVVADSLDDLLAGGRVLVDPVEFDAGGGVSLSSVAASPDGRFLAYSVSEAGSDWLTWRVRDIDSGVDLDDRLTHSKFSLAEWLPDSSGFLYWAYPDDAGAASGERADALGVGRMLLHRLGTSQDADEVVVHMPDSPQERAGAVFTDDDYWLIVISQIGTARETRVTARRLMDDGSFGPDLPVVPEPTAAYEFVGGDGDTAYFRTDQDAARGRLVAVDLLVLESSGKAIWREVVAERPDVLTMVERAGNGFVAGYLSDAAFRAFRLSLDGDVVDELVLDPPMSLVAISGKAGVDEVFVETTSFVEISRGYRIDMTSGEVERVPVVASEGEAEPLAIKWERRSSVSKDGTLVPYTLIRYADAPTGTPTPTILYGYGGFNIAQTPSFRVIWPAWLAAGGAVAIANLRGGGEFGRDWYEAGFRGRKQNVFDDFASVADDLLGSGVTSRDQLAIHGGSNGGLLVGAVMTQRPDIAAVALPIVGVLDMLRFHKFTIGWAWIADYGDPDAADDFEVLLKYSPLHNIRDGVEYPATLVLTGDHDDRVVPAHSHKFTAALQRAHVGDGPVLTRISTKTGHGLGKPRSAIIAEYADMLAFAAEHTGLQP